MHTYRKLDTGGWQAGYHDATGEVFTPCGPVQEHEWEAAAIVSFLNGGAYNEGALQKVMPDPTVPEDEDVSIHPDRPKAFDNDYPLEATQRHR